MFLASLFQIRHKARPLGADPQRRKDTLHRQMETGHSAMLAGGHPNRHTEDGKRFTTPSMGLARSQRSGPTKHGQTQLVQDRTHHHIPKGLRYLREVWRFQDLCPLEIHLQVVTLNQRGFSSDSRTTSSVHSARWIPLTHPSWPRCHMLRDKILRGFGASPSLLENDQPLILLLTTRIEQLRYARL